MEFVAIAGGIATIVVVFWDAFETLILPRRVMRRLGLASIYFSLTWGTWARTAQVIRKAARRENYLGFYGPLSLLFLVAVWAVGLVFGFALVQLGGGRFHPPDHALATLMYVSASTFVTLGLGDVTPANPFARTVTTVEAGAGFAFLALVIAYLPVLYQAFSRREVRISMLDERAGSPPSAGELLGRRAAVFHETGREFLHDWELWSAELLESHLSYPVLGYFRSQHDNQSWLAALTVILDWCALLLTGIKGIPSGQAQMTFAMARHAAVDLAITFGTPPVPPAEDRLPAGELERMRALLTERGVDLAADELADERLARLRSSYEPYVNALSLHLRMPLPRWMPADRALDNWEVTAWENQVVSRRPRRTRRRRGDDGQPPNR